MQDIGRIVVAHDPWFTALAVALCAAGSVVAVGLWRQALRARGPCRFGWAFAGVLVAGALVWATHYVAKLGYAGGPLGRLDPILAGGLGLGAAAGMGAGLGVAVAARGHGLALGRGALLGLALAVMHYLGLLAYRVDGVVSWDVRMLALSLAIVAASGALAADLARRRARWTRVAAPAAVAVAVLSLHVLSMAAVEVGPGPRVGTGADARSLAAATLTMALVILVVMGSGLVGHVTGHRQQLLAEDRLRHLASHDALTSLANRHRFGEALRERLAPPGRAAPAPFALLLVDLDRFKPVNDSLGHPTGDEVLRRVAARLVAAAGAEALIARIGGDEFAILLPLPAAGHPDAEAAGARIVELLSRPFLVDGSMAEIGASIGVAHPPPEGITPEALTQAADLALYAAKAAGRGQVRRFEPVMAQEMRLKRRLESDLRRAVAKEELDVVYQPQVDARTGRYTGAEALVRWRHPQRGPIPPATFVPLAEELGLVQGIGALVLRRACAEAAGWPAEIGVAVNLSPVQLLDPRLPRLVADVLDQTGLDPVRLELEITETALLSNDELALETLERLSAQGVRIALDDFGTGYSSLSYLHRFPIDRIKIDRSFVQRAPRDPSAGSITRAITQLGASLGLKVTAEGVETPEQRDWTVAQGCDDLQGFLFSRPVPAADLAALWARQGPGVAA